MIRTLLSKFSFSSSKYFQKQTVDFKLVGQRADQILQSNYDVSWNTLKKLQRKNKIFIKTQITTSEGHQTPKKIKDLSYRVCEKDEIFFPQDITKKEEYTLENLEKDEDELPQKSDENEINTQYSEQELEELSQIFKNMITFETHNFLFLNKQIQFSSQGGDNLEQNLYTIGSIYLAKQSLLFQKQYQYYIVHRLDKISTGTLLIAKNKQFSQILGNIISNKDQIQKYYISIVQGIPSEFQGLITDPLQFKTKATLGNLTDSKSKKCETLYQVLGQVVLEKKSKQVVETIIYNEGQQNNNNNYKEDILQYKQNKIKYYDPHQYYVFSILKLRIKDGRKHQIRAHMQYSLKTPILGDSRYGFDLNVYKSLIQYFKPQDQDKIKKGEHPVYLHCHSIQIQDEIIKADSYVHLSKEEAVNGDIGSVEIDTNSVKFQSKLPSHFQQFMGHMLKQEQKEQLSQLSDYVQF